MPHGHNMSELLQEPLVTVVIPTFNRGNLIAASIESVLRQRYRNLELIVVDDGSTDDTEAVVGRVCKTDSRIRYIKRPHERTKGANTCRNIGWEKARGVYIKWLDSDDLLEFDCVDVQVRTMLKEQVRVCFCKTGYFTEENFNITKLDRLWSERIVPSRLPDELVFGTIRWHTMGGLWRRSDFSCGPFQEGLMNSQEWFFHIRAALNSGFTATYLDEVLCFARIHAGSMSDKGNKKGRYYYNEAYARWLAIRELWMMKPFGYKVMIRFLLKKFGWFHIYGFYKGGYRYFFRLFIYYPRIFAFLVGR